MRALIGLFILLAAVSAVHEPSETELAMLEAQASSLTGQPGPRGVSTWDPLPHENVWRGPSDEWMLRQELNYRRPRVIRKAVDAPAPPQPEGRAPVLPPLPNLPTPQAPIVRMRHRSMGVMAAQVAFDKMSPFGRAVPNSDRDLDRAQNQIDTFPLPAPVRGESLAAFRGRFQVDNLKRQELSSIVMEEARRRAEIRNFPQPPVAQSLSVGPVAPTPEVAQIQLPDVLAAQRAFDRASPFGEAVPANDNDLAVARGKLVQAPLPAPRVGETLGHFQQRTSQAKLQREEALTVVSEEERRRAELRQPLPADLAAAQLQLNAHPPHGAKSQQAARQVQAVIDHEAERRQEGHILGIQIAQQQAMDRQRQEQLEFHREGLDLIAMQQGAAHPQPEPLPMRPPTPAELVEDEIRRRVAIIRAEDRARDAQREEMMAAAREDAIRRQAAAARASVYGSAPPAPAFDGPIARKIREMKSHVARLEAKIRGVSQGPLKDSDHSDSDDVLK